MEIMHVLSVHIRLHFVRFGDPSLIIPQSTLHLPPLVFPFQFEDLRRWVIECSSMCFLHNDEKQGDVCGVLIEPVLMVVPGDADGFGCRAEGGPSSWIIPSVPRIDSTFSSG